MKNKVRITAIRQTVYPDLMQNAFTVGLGHTTVARWRTS